MGLADVLIYDRIAAAVPGQEMSLPQALNALREGRIEPPAEVPGPLGKLLPPTSSLPTPKPRPDPLADIAAEQRAQDAADRHEMAVRIRAHRTVSPSQHMELAEQQLRAMEKNANV